MDLSEQQQQVVAGWVAEGASLADVQKRLLEEFQVSMTYMDVRFLVDDLELSLVDKTEKTPEPSAPDSSTPAEDPTPQHVIDDMDALADRDVKVEVDRLVRPGAVVSGNVTFSDGVTAEWYIDQMGRLGLNPSQEGYEPAPDDIQTFQKELQAALQKQGF